MANIIGIENMSEEEILYEIANGGRFVQYIWCVSVLLMTFKQPTDIYFIRAGESATKKGIGYSFLTFFLGWWGIPWGPIYSLQCLGKNLSGGYDLTDQFVAHFQSEPEQHEPEFEQYEENKPQLETATSSHETPLPIDTTQDIKPKEPIMPNPNGPVIQRRR